MAERYVLVTGGAGYIGSHACKALAAAGFVPVTYDDLRTGNAWAVKWGPLERGDILDADRLGDVLATYRPAAVMHFAAAALVGESMADPAYYYRQNVAGTLGLLEACRAAGVDHFVFASSCAVYGIPETLPIDETAPCRPINPYGAAKLMAERMLEDWDRAYGLRYAALRYFNAAGADPDGELGECRAVETHLIPLALEAALGRGQPLSLTGTDFPTPDGTAIRDYVHVSDLADAHLKALHHLLDGGPSLVCNLGTGRGYSVRQVLDAIAEITGRPVPCSIATRRPGDPPELVAAAASARRLLSWTANRSSLKNVIDSAWKWHSALISLEPST